MLHSPRAHRGALLSVSVQPLPADVDFVHRPMFPGWHLVIVRDHITYGELVRAYTRRLPGWARARLYTSLGVVDHAQDPCAYHRTRWWDEDWPITTRTEVMVAAAGRESGLLVPLPRSFGQMAG